MTGGTWTCDSGFFTGCICQESLSSLSTLLADLDMSETLTLTAAPEKGLRRKKTLLPYYSLFLSVFFIRHCCYSQILIDSWCTSVSVTSLLSSTTENTHLRFTLVCRLGFSSSSSSSSSSSLCEIGFLESWCPLEEPEFCWQTEIKPKAWGDDLTRPWFCFHSTNHTFILTQFELKKRTF